MNAFNASSASSSASRTSKTAGRAQHSLRRHASREQGMTTLGLMLVIAVVGLIAFGGIRLTPVYLNYLKVVGVLDGVYDEFDSQNPTRNAIKTSLNRRFQIESVSEINDREIKVTANNKGFVVAAQYDHTTPFIANIHFTVKFDKTIVVRK